MTLGTMNVTKPLISIQTPKKMDGTDLSDHFPIFVAFPGLKIVSYNLQLMPSIVGGVIGKTNFEEIKLTVNRISEYFKSINPDVCCVQELFDNNANRLLETEMFKNGYVATERIGESIIPYLNGGVRSFIKRDLAVQYSTHEYIYQNTIDYFIGCDALADKGIVQLSVHKGGVRYHIFNTHLQAYYPGREHYAEVTLAQCVELKGFLQEQIARGIIGTEDYIILCGDFNIPAVNDDQPKAFLFEKMKLILGPRFIFLNYETSSSTPKHTFSKENTHHHTKSRACDLDINADMCIVYDALSENVSTIDIELSNIYSDIQSAISLFVRKNASIFSAWHLSYKELKQLEVFNDTFSKLINEAQELQLNHENPLDNSNWFASALELLKGPGTSKGTEYISDINSMHTQNCNSVSGEVDSENSRPTNINIENRVDIEQCRRLFEGLIFKLRKVHAEIHSDYISDSDKYKHMFTASLKLNHVLFSEGHKFFKEPSQLSFNNFKRSVILQLTETEKEFADYPSIWSKIDPLIKQILGIFALLSVLPMLFIMANSIHGYKKTFFSPPSPTLDEIKDDLENNQDYSRYDNAQFLDSNTQIF